MRTLALTTCFLFIAAPCLAMVGSPPLLPSDSRIKLLPYDEGDVYTITTKYGYQTNIVFDEREDIETISLGDRSLWQITPSGNRLFIRPMQEDVITNMTVLTNRRSYQFDLKSANLDDKKAEIIYVAKFVYENRKPAPTFMPSMPPAMMPLPAKPSDMKFPVSPNYNYTYSGSDALAPLQVFDNGRATFIKYESLPEPLPEVYMVDAGGKAQVVPHDVKDKMLVVNAIAGELALKYGDSGTVNIYNETLNPQ